MIREQLAIEETPMLYCYLGDILNSAEHYLKAWEMSGQHFARAQRSLAYLHLRSKKVGKSLTGPSLGSDTH